MKTPSEAKIQSAFFQWISYYKTLRPYCFAIPNGGSRNILEAVNLKRQGVTKGVPDVFMAIPNEENHGLFIEFKAGKNKLTEEQKAMIDRLREKGYACEVCYSFEEAQKVIKSYIGEFQFIPANQLITDILCVKGIPKDYQEGVI